MVAAGVYLLLILYLPGAAIFRTPVLDRDRRAALDAEERAYWAVVLSVAWSSLVAFTLAVTGHYTFGRLLTADVLLVLVLAGVYRGRLRLERAATPGPAAIIPIALLVLGGYLFFPPAEYVIGGKDPGVYINEGIQIGQRGTVVTRDAVVASVPPPFRDLFFPWYHTTAYYSVRFMGFFITNPAAGTVVGQFPHLFPVWIAIGYGIYGLTGALHALGACALMGVLGVYFVGTRLAGRIIGAAGAALLAISVVQVWFARYPNAEMLGQALLFAGLLAFARSHVDDDPFFEPVAAVMLGLLFFTRIDGAIAVAAVAAAALLLGSIGISLRAAFLAPLMLMALLAFAYFVTVLSPYAVLPLFVLTHPTWMHVVVFGGAAVLVLALYVLARVPAVAHAVRIHLPRVLALVVVGLAIYAYFFREPGGRLAVHDANSLRMFTWYLHPAGLAASLIGLVLVAWTRFWRDPGFLLAACTYSLFVFYKIQIVPEHFWMARRFVMIVMPAALLLAAAAILTGLTTQLLKPGGTGRLLAKGDRFTRVAIRLALIVLLSSSLLDSTRPILSHREYEGVIPRLEALSHRFGDRDLVLVESRNASDLHVLALPLAYIYARNVLVLSTPKPNKEMFAAFLDWARGAYKTVYFLGEGGTDLISPRFGITVVGSEQFQVPEYQSLRNAYPTRARLKPFDFGIYRFEPPRAHGGASSLDLGTRDDLHVLRFHAKEHNDEATFRWTRDVSYVSLLGVEPSTRQLVLVMSNGGRPDRLPPATVEVFLDDRRLGAVTVGNGFRPYAFDIAPDVAAAASGTADAALVKIVSSTWNPRAALGAGDDRDLGVMIDRIDVH